MGALRYVNLYDELIEALDKNDKKLSDIKWIGVMGEGCFDTKQFLKIAKEFSYDSGFGLIEINEQLIVVGKDWWLERHEYDGSEWWEFKTMPVKPDNILKGTDDEIKEIIKHKWVIEK